MYEIDENIEMPSTKRYPFSDMEVGDSFAIGEYYSDMNRVKAAAHQWGKRHGKKFSVRWTDQGYRCWRIE